MQEVDLSFIVHLISLPYNLFVSLTVFSHVVLIIGFSVLLVVALYPCANTLWSQAFHTLAFKIMLRINRFQVFYLASSTAVYQYCQM